MPTLRHRCLAALATADIDAKLAAAHEALHALEVGEDASLVASATLPGRPERPLLVSPKDVPQRSLGTIPGRAALIHALAHIEFNAINLALDAIWRFSDMPRNYYTDWLTVAAEEAHHGSFFFCMVLSNLWLNSTALFWPMLLSFWSRAATSTSRARSRPMRTGMVMWGTRMSKIS